MVVQILIALFNLPIRVNRRSYICNHIVGVIIIKAGHPLKDSPPCCVEIYEYLGYSEIDAATDRNSASDKCSLSFMESVSPSLFIGIK